MWEMFLDVSSQKSKPGTTVVDSQSKDEIKGKSFYQLYVYSISYICIFLFATFT